MAGGAGGAAVGPGPDRLSEGAGQWRAGADPAQGRRWPVLL